MLLRHLRQSAELTYPRDVGFGELERRLLTEIHSAPALRTSDLIARCGVDKAQVSRAVKALTETGLVARADGGFLLRRGVEGLPADAERMGRELGASLRADSPAAIFA